MVGWDRKRNKNRRSLSSISLSLSQSRFSAIASAPPFSPPNLPVPKPKPTAAKAPCLKEIARTEGKRRERIRSKYFSSVAELAAPAAKLQPHFFLFLPSSARARSHRHSFPVPSLTATMNQRSWGMAAGILGESADLSSDWGGGKREVSTFLMGSTKSARVCTVD